MSSYEIRGTDGMMADFKQALDSGHSDFFLAMRSAEENRFLSEYNDAPDGPAKRDVVERWQRKFELESREAVTTTNAMRWRELELKARKLV